jgi:Flp pilus assembly protein TadB
MELDELKSIWWKKQKVEEQEYLSKEQLVMMLNNKMISFDEEIKKRDWREIGTAIVMSVICGVLLFILDSIWFKLSCVTIILASGLISYKLWAARRTEEGEELNPNVSFKKHLCIEMQKVKAQKKLLKSVLWWYLLPLFIGYLFFMIGFNFYWFITAGFVIFGLVLYAYIWKLNQDAVSKYIDPMITDIKNAIQFIEHPDV